MLIAIGKKIVKPPKADGTILPSSKARVPVVVPAYAVKLAIGKLQVIKAVLSFSGRVCLFPAIYVYLNLLRKNSKLR